MTTPIGRFYISQFFNQDALDKIKHWYKLQDWIDGSTTHSHNNKEIKNNLITEESIPNNLIWKHIDKNDSFIKFTQSHTSSKARVTKTPIGGYYHPHVDKLTLGNFSTTIFLNSPDQYDGGELILFIDGKEVQFKLDMGWGITYETGIGHRVNTVSRGERNVAIFWSHSIWTNIEAFREYKYWVHMCEREEEPICDNLYDYYNSNYVRWRERRDLLVRRHLTYNEMKALQY
jgi:PKHD-type hydroxylase